MALRYVPIVLVAVLLGFTDAAHLVRPGCQKTGANVVAMLMQGYETDAIAPTNMRVHKCIRDMFVFGQSREKVGHSICQRRPTFYECLDKLVDTSESSDIKMIYALQDVLNVVCAMDLTGTQITNFFIASRACFNSQLGAVRACFSKWESALRPITTSEQMSDLDGLRCCTITALKQCQERTVAAVVDALFEFVRQRAPVCAHAQSPAARPMVTTILLAITLAIVLVGWLVQIWRSDAIVGYTGLAFKRP